MKQPRPVKREKLPALPANLFVLDEDDVLMFLLRERRIRLAKEKKRAAKKAR